MDNLKKEKILSRCNTKGRGLEIGPSFDPVASKKEGYNIKIMDHLDRKGLIEKYKSQPAVPNDLENLIEEVDYVWQGQRYPELVDGKFDYVISSHLIEHVPDIIGHLNDVYEILNPGGVYSLAIPDKRYTFDHHREITSPEKMIARKGNTGYDDELVIEYHEMVVKNNEEIAWNKLYPDKNYSPVYSPQAIAAAKEDPQGNVEDFHVSVFTPKSFYKTMKELYRREEIKLAIEYVDEDTLQWEFFAVFRKDGDIGKAKFHPIHPLRIPYNKMKMILHR